MDDDYGHDGPELAPLALAAAVGLAFLALLLEQMGVIR